MLGRGYNEILSKISERHDQIKKGSLLIIQICKFDLIETKSRFEYALGNLSMHDAKQRLANDISQMIMQNLSQDHNRNSQEYIINTPSKCKIKRKNSLANSPSKHRSSIGRFVRREIPNVENFITPVIRG